MNWKLHDLTVYGREFQPNDHYQNRIIARVLYDTFSSVRLHYTDGTDGGVQGDLQYDIQRPVISA